jgi:arginyl-tRNA synthetase
MTSMWSPTGVVASRRYPEDVPPHPLSVAVVRALDVLVDEDGVPWQGALPDAEEADDARVPRSGAAYATSLPLRLTGRAGVPAHELARLLAARLGAEPGVGSARVAGPGYVEMEPDPVALLRVALTPVGSQGPRRHGALDPLPRDPDAELRFAVAEVGEDAVRFALARRPGDAASPLDLQALGRADDRNPVHAVQLAHARLAGLLRQGEALGVNPAELDDVAPELLAEPRARELVAAVAETGPVAARALRLERPDLLARHLSATAEAAHRYLSSCRTLPTGDELPDRRHRAQLRLALAARDGLALGLDLLGVTAPGRM